MNIKEIEEQINELEVYIESLCTLFARQYAEKLVKQFCDRFDARFYSGIGMLGFEAFDKNHPRWTIPDENGYLYDVSDLSFYNLRKFGKYYAAVYSDDSILKMARILQMDLNGSSIGEYLKSYIP